MSKTAENYGKREKTAARPQHLREVRTQGTEAFPCTLYRADSATDPLPFYAKMHWHDAIEVLHFEKGTFALSANMEQAVLEEECYVFLEGGTLHSIRCEDGFLEQAILFEPEFLTIQAVDESEREILTPLRQGALHFPGAVTKDLPVFEEIDTEFKRIRKVFESRAERHEDQMFVNDPSAQLKIRASLMLMLAALWDADLLTYRQRSADPRIESLKKVIAFIREHYGSKIYIAELAAIMNMNEQYFCRFFRKAMGKTPIRYINEVRIRQAMTFLEHTDMPVTEIGMNCGFGNMGHFIEEFRRLNGTTPLDYRKKAKQRNSHSDG